MYQTWKHVTSWKKPLNAWAFPLELLIVLSGSGGSNEQGAADTQLSWEDYKIHLIRLMTGKSESTLRRDVKKGKVSAGRDDRRHLRFDISELQRAYGELKNTGDDAQPIEQGNGKAMTGHDRAEILAIKDNQIADLKAQLKKADRDQTS